MAFRYALELPFLCSFSYAQNENRLDKLLLLEHGQHMNFIILTCVVACADVQVIQWCTHHKDDPPPPEDDENKEKRTDDIPVWDQEFLKVDQGTLFELILVGSP